MRASPKSFKSHSLQAYNRDLEALMNHILELGGLVEKQLDLAVSALQLGDVEKAREVRQLDRLINETEQNTDKAAIQLVARHQPTASDLRLIISSLRIGIDLERVGDEVVKLARMVEHYDRMNGACEQLKMGSDFYRLIDLARGMLKHALDGYARLNMKEAIGLLEDEEAADALYKTIMAQVTAELHENACDRIDCYLEFITVVKAVERMTDHLANVAESIIYIINGRDVRSPDHDMIEKLASELSEEDAQR